ncbi:MAG: MFS transporter [Bacteroidales bacterium]|nr:MFS transporter [Bacteroidales bacterium]MCF8389059.1 MFS transporter [Bacteroidales bacterium]
MKETIQEKDNFQAGNITLIGISHFIHDVYTSFLAPALPFIIEKIGISYGLAGLLHVIQRIPSLLNPLVGIMADRMRMRYLVIFSPALTGIAMSLIGIAPSYIFLALLLLVSGISSTVFHIPTPVMVKKLAGNRIGKGMSFYMLGGELARTAGPMVIYGIISLWGLEGTYKMMPLGLIASAILFFRLRHVDISQNVQKQEFKKAYWKEFKKYIPIFTVTAGITLFLGAMRSALALYLPTFMDTQGESLFFSQASLSVLQLSGAAGTLMSGTFSDKLGRTKMLLIITIVSPFLMFLFLHVFGIWKMLVLGIMGMFLFSPTSVLLALIHDQDSNKMAFLNGVYMLLNFFISAVMVTVAGFMADKIGFEKTFAFAAFFSLGSVVVVLLNRKKLG